MSSEYGPDLAYIHHTGFGEFAESAAPGLLEILWKHGIRDGLIVEMGCGSGILARELTRAGFEVLGVDASPSMIALAKETSPGARFDVGTFATYEIPRCKAVIAMGEVLNYGGRKSFPQLFASCAKAGAMLIFDFAERGSYPPYDERRVDGQDFTVIAIKKSDGVHLTREVTTYREGRRSRETHLLELYDRAEIAGTLRDFGYRVRFRRSYGTRRLPKGHAVCLAVPR
jgi:SAM-dependent methyltransferase